ncbi:MAG: hypothetical protein ACI30K_05025 [Muribaculaceae bacterium]
MNNTILMTEGYWAASQFSSARYTGGCKINGKNYIIVDKRGRDVYECTAEAMRVGREKAIEPGEPCDLVRCDYVQVYRKLGRDKFIAWLSDSSLQHDPISAHEYAGIKFRKI